MTATYGGRTLLVGLGGIGMGYDLASGAVGDAGVRAGTTIHTHAAAIMECAATELIGGVDPCEGRRLEFESAFQAPAWASISEIPESAVDIVVIATPTETHREVTAQALTAFSPGLLLCEKPVGASADDTRNILSMAEQHGTVVIVNYFRHYLPVFRDVREELRRGNFGQLSGGSVLYSHGLRRNGSHFVALLLWMFGDAQVCVRVARDAMNEDPGFALCFGEAEVSFSSIGHQQVRAAEIFLGFSRGLLSITSGGRAITWAEVDDGGYAHSPSYGEVQWQRWDDMLRCQLPVYQWLTTSSLSPSEVAEDISVAMRTQEIIDEVTRGAR